MFTSSLDKSVTYFHYFLLSQQQEIHFSVTIFSTLLIGLWSTKQANTLPVLFTLVRNVNSAITENIGHTYLSSQALEFVGKYTVNIAFARGGAHLPIAHALRLLSTKLNLRKNNCFWSERSACARMLCVRWRT